MLTDLIISARVANSIRPSRRAVAVPLTSDRGCATSSSKRCRTSTWPATIVLNARLTRQRVQCRGRRCWLRAGITPLPSCRRSPLALPGSRRRAPRRRSRQGCRTWRRHRVKTGTQISVAFLRSGWSGLRGGGRAHIRRHGSGLAGRSSSRYRQAHSPGGRCRGGVVVNASTRPLWTNQFGMGAEDGDLGHHLHAGPVGVPEADDDEEIRRVG